MEQTLPKLLQRVAREHGTLAAHYTKNSDGNFVSNTFADYFQTALNIAGGLLSITITRGNHIGLISDNRREWAFFDMGLLALGAIDVPRGCDVTEKDLAYILSFAECSICAAEDSVQVRKILTIKNELPLLKTLICFDEAAQAEIDDAKKLGITLYQLDDIVQRGIMYRAKNPDAVEKELEKGQRDDLATIIFTSGTTGEPKGVMLSHGNFLTQLDELPERILLNPGEKALSVLPIWHSFERMCEYVILNAATAICFSKPIGSILLADFKTLNPQIMPAVPRVFEAIYEGIYRAMRKTGGVSLALFTFFVHCATLHSKIDRKLRRTGARFKKDNRFVNVLAFGWLWLLLYPFKALGNVLVFKKIRAKLGNNFTAGISGGGALPPAVDEFFWAVGVNIVEGYGLTETAPVVSVRPFSKPVFGTVGSPIRGVAVRIVGENGEILPAGKKGLVQVRGGIVMQGYYRRPDLTAKVMKDGDWLDTGDLGMLTIDGELVLRGRLKDTIVLRGGENIEPLPLEMHLTESRYIAQAVVLGQDECGTDQRFLGALIVPAQDEVMAYAAENNILHSSFANLLRTDAIKQLFENEIKTHVCAKTGCKLFERINKFVLLEKSFEVGVELSIKQEVMRYKMKDLYPAQIRELFKGNS